jgi:hypothetical protein
MPYEPDDRNGSDKSGLLARFSSVTTLLWVLIVSIAVAAALSFSGVLDRSVPACDTPICVNR